MTTSPLSERGPAAMAWLLTLAMAATCAAIVSLWPDHRAILTSRISWPLLVVAFLVAELAAIHLPTRRGAHTLFMVELPLVVGIALTSDTFALVGSRVAASMICVLLIRRRDALRVAFNAASAGLSTGAAIVVTGVVAGDRPVDDPVTWMGLLLGAVTAGMASAGSVSLVLSIFDPLRDSAERRQELVVGAIQSAIAGAVAVIVVIGLTVNPFTILLTTGVVIASVAGLNVYGSLHRRHTDLTTLYSFSVGFDPRAEYHDLITSTAQLIGTGMRAERVTVVTHAPEGRFLVTRLGPSVEGTVHLSDSALDSLVGLRSVGLLEANRSIEELIGEGVERVAVAPLGDIEGDPVGVILVADRDAGELAFDGHDLDLLATMARHTGLNLERALLENRLRAEIEANRSLIASKDRLIAAVSHELRTPLTAILGFAELLTESTVGETERTEMTTTIAQEAQDLAHIVEDLLTAARFEAGGLATKSERVNVTELVKRVVEPVANRTSRVIDTEVEDTWAVADGPRVRQILRNLVTNALRHGGPEIGVRAFEHGGEIHIQVRDNGSGVSQQDLQRIFLPYQTANESGTQPGSVGLGLTIARELARMMGGNVSASVESGWTVFDLTLPSATATRSIA